MQLVAEQIDTKEGDFMNKSWFRTLFYNIHLTITLELKVTLLDTNFRVIKKPHIKGSKLLFYKYLQLHGRSPTKFLFDECVV